MGIGGILKRLPASTLRKAWRAAHAITESKSMEELAQTIFHELGALAPHDTAVIYAQDPLTLAPLPGAFFLKNIDGAGESVRRYSEYYFNISPVLRTVGDPRYNNIGFSESDIVKQSEFLDSEYYVDFFKPMGLLHTMTLNTAFHGKTVGTIALHRPPGAKDYSDREKAALTLAAPVIAGAFFAAAMRGGLYHLPAAGAFGMLGPYRLSAREERVAGLILRGFSNNEIAGQLFISEKTVKAHITSILRKTGAKSRMKLIALLTSQPAPGG
ncbi:MAG: helix-turn-helix transcriptional regulator [Nitrospinae bacterium]|nr:helix-turn-helix transcriptional regulator [Nitrospinota bacterium]